MIEFKNASKSYDNKSLALDDVSFTISDGEFVFIVGASGSGKSTLLKLLTKEEELTSGKIIINGDDITKLKKRKIPYLRRMMGVVFQDFRVIEKMTVFENVAFAMHIVGARSKEIRRRVPYVLNLVNLENKARNKVSELSGGEKQRVGIARALVNNPSIIIADEPTGNIDPSMSYEIVELLNQINKCGTTVVMVTHDISIVKKFNFRVIEISEGKLKRDTKSEKEAEGEKDEN
ncbi:MAG: cell division ATP-binding protein FtsE [Clostridia bacterium]|nr:cell division ATP-binding protein FtsE [Clostridia bacterium]